VSRVSYLAPPLNCGVWPPVPGCMKLMPPDDSKSNRDAVSACQRLLRHNPQRTDDPLKARSSSNAPTKPNRPLSTLSTWPRERGCAGRGVIAPVSPDIAIRGGHRGQADSRAAFCVALIGIDVTTVQLLAVGDVASVSFGVIKHCTQKACMAIRRRQRPPSEIGIATWTGQSRSI
jgi:hypothetical protein